MKQAYKTYDPHHGTWNILEVKTNECLYYGTSTGADKWATENKDSVTVLDTFNKSN